MTPAETAAAAIRQFPFDNYGLDEVDVLLHDSPDTQEWVDVLAARVVDALAEVGFRDARVLERPGSALCSCRSEANAPVNPKTGTYIDHHCDCVAVEAAALLLGAFARSEHARQCVCGASA